MEPFLNILWMVITIHIIITWTLSIWRGRTARQREIHQQSIQIMDLPAVSIIVPAWNEKGTIEKCIQSLKKINYPVWETIILAGGQDGTYEATVKETTDDPRFIVLERGPEAKNIAINRGIENTHYGIVVILDADSIVDQDWLKELIKPINSGAAASYGFYLPQKETWITIHETIVQISYHIHGSNAFPGCASVAIRKDILEKIGPLTAEAYSWEDWDVYARIVEAGGKIVPCLRAKLISDRPTTFREYWQVNMRAFRTHLAGLWFHRKVAIQHPIWALNELFFLCYGASICLAFIAGVIIVLIQPSSFPIIGNITALFIIWICGRRAAIIGEAVAFTGESKWFAWSWTPSVLLLVQIPATFVAFVTVRNQPSFDYKGRRELHPA